MSIDKSYKVLIICTSNQDRSPAIESYLKEVYPEYEYKSAGVNNYYCKKKGTHYLTHDDIRWCDLILFAEYVHMTVFIRDFGSVISNGYISYIHIDAHKDFNISPNLKGHRVLNCGKYEQGQVGEDYLTKVDLIFKEAIS